MNRYVFDACALIAYLHDETGADSVERILFDADSDISVHIINLLEVYYDIYRIEGKEKADEVLESLKQFPFRIIDCLCQETFLEAGRLKATFRLSLADAIAVAETKHLNAILVSADHHELDVLEKNGSVSILWIR